RFKHLRKYTYNYEAESSSGVPGTADSRSATRINCKVELEVPQLCSFILKTSQCTLKEVYGFNPEGKALLKKTKNSEEFAAAMSRIPCMETAPLTLPSRRGRAMWQQKYPLKETWGSVIASSPSAQASAHLLSSKA
ncbi:apolipoprotein B, partial [Homo sapiens]